MHRWCAVHGESESLYERDAELWRSRNGWQTPTLAITPDRSTNAKGFPGGYRDGLPASHGQHTCILLLNVTENCNYACPTCYASALNPATQAMVGPSQDELIATVKTMIAREGGQLSVVMLSGGEPTVRKDITEIISSLCELPITRILLNTNGRRISRDDKFLRFLRDHRDRIEVYLQFDGLESHTYEVLRGEDVAKEKLEALSRLTEARIFTTLVTTLQNGVNDHELGNILNVAMSAPTIAGWAIQPVFGSGRSQAFDPQTRATPTGVRRDLEIQSEGRVKASDFIPLPCSHKDCCDIAYFIRDKHDEWKSVLQLIGSDELKRWIHIVSNTISFESASDAVKEMVRDGVLQRVLSEQQRASSLKVAADLYRMCDCVPGLSDLVTGIASRFRREEILAERTLRVTVKMFMDAHTFHEARIRQCCVHVGTFEDDPRRYSFCWRWMFDDASDRPGRTPLRML